MYYFYVLKSSVDDEFYYGSTDNLKRRFNEHNDKKVVSTAHRAPLDLVYYEAYRLIELARKRERQIKKSGNARRVLKERI